MGINQNWATFLANPILWNYVGQTFGHTVQWSRRPGDELVVVIAVNSVPNTAAKIEIPPLYETVMGILEPHSVIDLNAAPSPSLPRHDLARISHRR
jgi:hypothetical protein